MPIYLDLAHVISLGLSPQGPRARGPRVAGRSDSARADGSLHSGRGAAEKLSVLEKGRAAAVKGAVE